MKGVTHSFCHRPMGTVLVVFGVLVLLTGVGLLMWGQYQSMPLIAHQLDEARPWLTVWRFALYALVIIGWPWWVAVLSKRASWKDAFHQQLLGLRWRLAGWLLVLELLLAQNLLGLLILEVQEVVWVTSLKNMRICFFLSWK